MVAAIIMFIASIGVFMTMGALVRNTEMQQRDMQASRILRASLDFMREVGYEGLIASGSTAIASSIVTQYGAQIAKLGAGSTVGLSIADTTPGMLMDATLSITFRSENGGTKKLKSVIRIVKGGPL